MTELALLMIAFVTTATGALAGLGGAVILVPALVLLGWTVPHAAPLGLLSVVAGSVAAGGLQLVDRLVNHRLGVTTELMATTGAVVGALVSSHLPDDLLVILLAVVAIGAAILSGFRRATRNLPAPLDRSVGAGERVGSLDGTYRSRNGLVTYQVKRLHVGLVLMSIAGLVAGSTGTSGGFLKTPTSSEIMHVPTKVAAATTTFTIGMTASAALVVFIIQGRLDVREGSVVVLSSVVGGVIGADLQHRLPARTVRRTLSIVLVGIALLLLLSR